MLASYFFLSLLSSSALAYDLANYPAPAAPASGNATLMQLLLQGQTIVKSAPRGKGSPTNDWTLDITSCNSASHWAITYDDGPSAEFTPSVLAELARHDLKATFFVTGSNVVKYPQILIDTYKAGHTIGIHTWNHDYLSSLR
jgi:peptidoglycan/xylan/chitin deacetylase (PgdA/CDA1 family)